MKSNAGNEIHPAAPANAPNNGDKAAEKNVADAKNAAPPPTDTAIQADKAAVDTTVTCLDTLKNPPKDTGTPGISSLILTADSVTIDANAQDKKVIWGVAKSSSLSPNDLITIQITKECEDTGKTTDSAGLNLAVKSESTEAKVKSAAACDPSILPTGAPSLREYAMGASMTGGASGVACQKGDANTETKEFEVGTVTLVSTGKDKEPEVEAVIGIDVGTASGKYKITMAGTGKKRDWALSHTFEVHSPAPQASMP